MRHLENMMLGVSFRICLPQRECVMQHHTPATAANPDREGARAHAWSHPAQVHTHTPSKAAIARMLSEANPIAGEGVRGATPRL